MATYLRKKSCLIHPYISYFFRGHDELCLWLTVLLKCIFSYISVLIPSSLFYRPRCCYCRHTVSAEGSIIHTFLSRPEENYCRKDICGPPDDILGHVRLPNLHPQARRSWLAKMSWCSNRCPWLARPCLLSSQRRTETTGQSSPCRCKSIRVWCNLTVFFWCPVNLIEFPVSSDQSLVVSAEWDTGPATQHNLTYVNPS